MQHTHLYLRNLLCDPPPLAYRLQARFLYTLKFVLLAVKLWLISFRC